MRCERLPTQLNHMHTAALRHALFKMLEMHHMHAKRTHAPGSTAPTPWFGMRFSKLLHHYLILHRARAQTHTHIHIHHPRTLFRAPNSEHWLSASTQIDYFLKSRGYVKRPSFSQRLRLTIKMIHSSDDSEQSGRRLMFVVSPPASRCTQSPCNFSFVNRIHSKTDHTIDSFGLDIMRH